MPAARSPDAQPGERQLDCLSGRLALCDRHQVPESGREGPFARRFFDSDICLLAKAQLDGVGCLSAFWPPLISACNSTFSSILCPRRRSPAAVCGRQSASDARSSLSMSAMSSLHDEAPSLP